MTERALETAPRPPRVLHIVESIDRGAVENWLLRLYRFARATGAPIDWTFYCILPTEGRRESELTALGARVVRSPVALGNSVAFARRLREFVRQEGFDVVHAHHDVLSGLYLLALTALPLRRRVVHVHNADLSLPTPSRSKARLLGAAFTLAIRRQADAVVGISGYVVDEFVRRARVSRSKSEVLLYGVDTAPFRSDEQARKHVRRAERISDDQRALLFIGRLTWFKNPVFVIDILAELLRRGENVVAMFAGTGPEESAIRRRAAELNVEHAVRHLGWRDDAAALMAAADVFVFPREEKETDEVGKEGLGLTVVEAQAAGLPIVVSRAIPREALVIPDACQVVGIDAGVPAWADAAIRALRAPRLSADRSTAAVDASPLSMPRSLESMMRLHAQGTAA